jgi:AcrR family transcriptional regulator
MVEATADGNEDPRPARRAGRIEQIVAAAWDLADRDGLAAISMRDVARAVGLRQPSLYTYFDAKSDIYDAMFSQGFRQITANAEALTLTDDPVEDLKDWTRRFLEFVCAKPSRTQLMFQGTVPGFEPSPQSRALEARYGELAMDQVRRVGALGVDDLDIYIAMVAGIASVQIGNDPTGDRWVRRSDEMVEIYTMYLRNRHGR